MPIDWRTVGLAELQVFLLTLARVATVFGVAPVFSLPRIPPLARVGVPAIVSLLLYPGISWDPAVFPLGWTPLAWAVATQVMVGFVLALSVWTVFIGVQLAGQVVDLAMGFGIVNVIDPMTSAQESILGQFLYLLAILLYFAIDGHLWLLRGFADSFRIVPLLGEHAPGDLFFAITRQMGFLFADSVQLAGPAIVVLVLTNLILGLLSRTMPQMNVFIVGLPLSIGVGLLAVAASIFFFASMTTSLLGRIPGDLSAALRILGHR